jgi:putative cell wall-binding protein
MTLAAVLAVLLGAVWVAPPAAAEATCFADATGDTIRSEGPFQSRIEAYPRADVTSVCAEITSGVVSLSLRVAEPRDPALDAGTSVTWSLKTDGQDVPRYFVTYTSNRDQAGEGQFGSAPPDGADVHYSEGDIACEATASFDGTSYGATFPSSCIGGATTLEVSAGISYDAYPCDPTRAATPTYSDGSQDYLGPVAAGTGTAPSPAEMASVEADTCRVSGADRYSTAVAASENVWNPADLPGRASVVVLARGDAFADALAGTPLAAAKAGPLLLTPATSLSPVTANEIKRVLPRGQAVFLLGGTAAISAGVATAIKDLGFNPVRLAGPDRYATATAIARQIPDRTGIFLATGLSFPDALVAGAAAAATRGVVLLTADGKMPPPTSGYIGQNSGVRRTAVGREAAAADPSADRIVGTDKYQTSRLLAEAVFGDFPRFAGVASGTVFADGLAGGAHAVRFGKGPLLLSEPGALPASVRGYFNAHPSIERAYLYGGTAALSPSVQESVRNSLNGR